MKALLWMVERFFSLHSLSIWHCVWGLANLQRELAEARERGVSCQKFSARYWQGQYCC